MTHTDVSLSPTKLSEPVLAFATRFARQQAQNLVGHFGFRSDDCDDLTQELLLAVVERWPTFDRSRSQPEAFATVVMRKQVASLIRQRFVQKRQFDQLLGSPDTSDNADTATRFRTGDRIRQINGPAYEVLAPGHEPPFRYSDPFGQVLHQLSPRLMSRRDDL